MAMEVFISEVV